MEKLFLIFIISLFQMHCLYSQDVTFKVQEKTFTPERKKTLLSKEIFYKNFNLVYEKIYTYNGWQVVDSISYDKDLCFKVYQPIYDVENRLITRYDYKYNDCLQINSYCATLHIFYDDFLILHSYYNDICFALLNKNVRLKSMNSNTYIYEFQEPSSPSLFIRCGIPRDENLISLTIRKEGNMIMEDEFNFQNFSLKRMYFYNEHLLEKVEYIIVNKKDKKTLQHYKTYEYIAL